MVNACCFLPLALSGIFYNCERACALMNHTISSRKPDRGGRACLTILRVQHALPFNCQVNVLFDKIADSQTAYIPSVRSITRILQDISRTPTYVSYPHRHLRNVAISIRPARLSGRLRPSAAAARLSGAMLLGSMRCAAATARPVQWSVLFVQRTAGTARLPRRMRAPGLPALSIRRTAGLS